MPAYNCNSKIPEQTRCQSWPRNGSVTDWYRRTGPQIVTCTTVTGGLRRGLRHDGGCGGCACEHARNSLACPPWFGRIARSWRRVTGGIDDWRAWWSRSRREGTGLERAPRSSAEPASSAAAIPRLSRPRPGHTLRGVNEKLSLILVVSADVIEPGASGRPDQVQQRRRQRAGVCAPGGADSP